jgi:hypothetical protein
LFNTFFCDPIEGDINSESYSNSDSKTQSSESKFSGEVVKNNDGKEQYVFKADKELMDSVVSGVKERAKMVVEHVIPNLTTGFVGSSVGVAMVKATTGMPPAQRALLVAGTSGLTSASVTLGNK